jgi:hypothetical protein
MKISLYNPIYNSVLCGYFSGFEFECERLKEATLSVFRGAII